MSKKLIKLIELASSQNITEELSKEQLIKIGRDVVRLTEHDDSSREAWTKRSKDAMDLALQVVKESSFPWPNSSNIKYPTITIAALAFHARTLPVILSGNRVAKAKVTGADKDGEKEKQANRVADYINYQLLHEMPDWEEGMDKMLLALPIEGCEFKKTYFSPEIGTNISEWIRPEDFIVNYKTKSLEECPRATHRIWISPQRITERNRMGIWTDADVTADLNISVTDIEDEKLQEFYEQHCLLDIDEDGYKEPWCVTVHKDSGKVVRIKADFAVDNISVKTKTKVMPLTELGDADKGKATIAKIDKINYFTKYSFIPSPDGGFYDIGLGQIVGPINDSISTILNQIVDAGTLQNIASNSGFIADGASIGNKRGPVNVQLGKYQKIKLPAGMKSISDAFFQLQGSGPSAVLFNTLGTLIGAAKDIAGVQDIHTGGTEKNETATTTMIRVEEGQKVFNAIYKRIYRALGKEITKIYDLNAIYLDPETYFNVLDTNEQGVITLSDFRNDGTDVQPMADPSMSNTAQKVAKAEALMSQMANPLLNKEEITRRYLDALDVANVDSLMVDQSQLPPPPPDPTLEKLALDAQKLKNADENDDKRVLIEQFKAEVDAYKAETERMKTKSDISVSQVNNREESMAFLDSVMVDLGTMEPNLEEDEMDAVEPEVEQGPPPEQIIPEAPLPGQEILMGQPGGVPPEQSL